MPVNYFRELRVYQQAFRAAVEIQRASTGFPVAERYSLTDQVRRASRSVCANIGEAWQNRRYERSFISKLRDADAEATETQIWLDFACEFGYLSADLHARLLDEYAQIGRQLHVILSNPEKWTFGSAKTTG